VEGGAAAGVLLAASGVALAEAGGVEVTHADVVAPVGRQAVEEAVDTGCQNVDLLARAVADVQLVVAVRQALRIADIDLAVVVGVDVQAVAALVPGGARGLVGDLGPAPAARAGVPPAGQVAAPGRLEDVGAGPVVGHLLDLAVDVDDATLGLAVVRWSVGQAGWVGAGRLPGLDRIPWTPGRLEPGVDGLDERGGHGGRDRELHGRAQVQLPDRAGRPVRPGLPGGGHVQRLGGGIIRAVAPGAERHAPRSMHADGCQVAFSDQTG